MYNKHLDTVCWILQGNVYFNSFYSAYM